MSRVRAAAAHQLLAGCGLQLATLRNVALSYFTSRMPRRLQHMAPQQVRAAAASRIPTGTAPALEPGPDPEPGTDPRPDRDPDPRPRSRRLPGRRPRRRPRRGPRPRPPRPSPAPPPPTPSTRKPSPGWRRSAATSPSWPRRTGARPARRPRAGGRGGDRHPRQAPHEQPAASSASRASARPPSSKASRSGCSSWSARPRSADRRARHGERGRRHAAARLVLGEAPRHQGRGAARRRAGGRLHRRDPHADGRGLDRRGPAGRGERAQGGARRAASSPASAPPRTTSTASTSRRTPRSSAASRRCWCASRRSRTRSTILKGLVPPLRAAPQACATRPRRSRPRPPLAARYITDRFLPDKAVAVARPRRLARAPRGRGRGGRPQDVARVVAKMAGHPRVSACSLSDSRRGCSARGATSRERVIGHGDGDRARRRACCAGTTPGFASPPADGHASSSSAPPASGKTELARALADVLFGRRDALVRLDMSECAEAHGVARLVGARARLRRLRRGRAAHRAGAPPPVVAWWCSTRSRRRTATC